LVLADGTKKEADIVVLATGYDNMRTSARKIFGNKVADRCKDVWDLDDEGEVNAVSLAKGVQVDLTDLSLDVATEWSSWILVHGW
jgi:hypothetical protein